ncbi:hypothetical protein ACQ4PT_044862 [Festuca glaucescens]
MDLTEQPQHSPTKKMAGKEMPKSPPSQLSAGEHSLHKEFPAKDHPQVHLFEPGRSEPTETLAAALSMHSDHQFGHQSTAGNVPPLGSASGNMQADGGRMQGITTAFQDDDENVTKVVARTSEHGDMLCSNLSPLMPMQVRGDMQHVPLGNKASGNSSATLDDIFQDDGLGTVVGPYEPMSQPNPKRARMSDVHAGIKVSAIGPERVVATDETTAEKKVTQNLLHSEVQSVVGLGGGSLSYSQAKYFDETSVHKEIKESDSVLQDGAADTCNSTTSSNSEYPASEPMIEDVQVTQNSPEIMTLDEFMDLLYSETHSEDQFAGALQEDPSIDKDDKALKSESFPIAKDKAVALKFEFHSDLRSPQDNFESKLESPINKSVSIMDPVLEPKGDVIVKFPPEKVTELCLKEGSLESGWHHLMQTIDSYIADGRVGLVKPAEWVEIYLCPQGEAAKILADHLPKEHSSSLTVTETSIIGLVVWRRPHVSPKVPPNRQDVPMISSSVVPRIAQPPSRSSNACCSHQDVVTTVGPPGFGLGVVKDDDDLPEYKCESLKLSLQSSNVTDTQEPSVHFSFRVSKNAGNDSQVW